eukprot:COSAG01_NODE_25978_length_727_cov_1.101911_2_plen_20_part_01
MEPVVKELEQMIAAVKSIGP